MNNNTTFNEPESETNSTVSEEETYTELINRFCVYLSQSGKKKQQIKNARRAGRSWCKILSLDPGDFVGDEFTLEFETCLENYISKQISLNVRKSTYASVVSNIRAIRTFYLKHRKSTVLPTTFGKRLNYLFNAAGYSAKKIWEHHLKGVIEYETLLGWVSEQHSPSRKNFTVVQLIERCLSVPVGTLTSVLEHGSPFAMPLASRSRTKAGEIDGSEYGIWTEGVDKQYMKLVHFKTAVTLPEGISRRRKSRWTGGTADQLPPSARIFKQYLKCFFGFCCLPPEHIDPRFQGLGMDFENVSLSLLTNIEIVEGYFTVFRLKRSKGIYNTGTITFAGFITSLLRKETGYLYQSSEFCGENPSAEDISQWRERCLKARKRILDLLMFVKEEKYFGGEKFGFGRDPKEPIRDILEAPRPLDITLQMIGRMLADFHKLRMRRRYRAILYRDILLISMLQVNPLRSKMFSTMEIGRHLIKKADGSWWLKFKRHEFKNRHALKDDYQVRIASEIWSLIDRYINDFRPLLSGADKSDRLFLSSHPGTPEKFGLCQNALGSIVVNRTKQYIANCTGFRLHSFRHIVATNIIKNNPEFGFFLAAKVLHDSILTVEENYAHLKTSEFFEPYNRLFSQSWNALNLSAVNTIDESAGDENREADKNEEESDEK